MDDSIGRLLRILQEEKLEEKTLVLFLSDNGAHDRQVSRQQWAAARAKGMTYEGGIRVPAIARWPGRIPAGWVSEEDAVHFDVFSTILDAAGLPIPARTGAPSTRTEPFAAPHLRW